MNSSKRDHIIAAGARAFSRMGYHGTTVEDIIREAGVARSTFYAYFRDKRELFLKIATGRTTYIVRTLTAGIDSITDALETPAAETPGRDALRVAVSDLIETMFRFVRSSRGLARIFLHEMVGADGEFTRIFNDYQEALVSQAERLVRYCVRIGAMSATDTRAAAEFIVSGHMYLAMCFSAAGGRYDVEGMSRRFVDYQFDGLTGAGREASLSAGMA